MAGFRVDVAEAAAAACRWRFDNAAADRAEAAQQGKLVTFGIVPTRPETGYGYVQARPGGESVVAVVAFVEKPDLETAQLYVEAGEHFWNSGIFLFSAKSYLHELSKFSPEIHKNMQKSIEKCIKNVGAPHEAQLVHAPGSANRWEYRPLLERLTRRDWFTLQGAFQQVGVFKGEEQLLAISQQPESVAGYARHRNPRSGNAMR